MRAKSFNSASEAIEKSLVEIDAYHKKFQKDTWINGTKGKLMVSLSRIPNEENIV